MKIRSFFLKYSGRIITCVVLLLLSIFFIPSQETYYLRDTVKHFERHILQPGLLGFCILLFLIIAVLRIINVKPLKDALFGAFTSLIFLVMITFIFERLALSGILFVNRLVTTDRDIEKQYVVKFSDDSAGIKHMLVFDPVSNEYSEDEVLIKNIRQQGVLPKGLVTVLFDKGIFGIEHPHKIDAK